MKTSMMTIDGNSMNCLLMNADVVLIDQQRKIGCGDIFVYNFNGSKIIHRVLFVGFLSIWEAGDNNYRIRKVKKTQVVAKVVANITRNIDLDSPKLNRKITRLNFLRCLLGKNITSTRSLMKNKTICKLILMLTKYRNSLQLQYKKYGED